MKVFTWGICRSRYSTYRPKKIKRKFWFNFMTQKTFLNSDYIEARSTHHQSVDPKNIIGVSKTDAQDALDLTQYIIDQTGPRLAGSKSCHKAAKMLKNELDDFCDQTYIEEFAVRPESFLGFTKLIAICYIISAICVLIGREGIYIAALSLFIGLLVALSQFIFYWKIFDIFYQKKKGFNVSGILEPAGEIRQQIVLSGHHDSAFEFNFLKKKAQRWYSPRIFLGMIMFIVANVASYIWLIDHLIIGHEPSYVIAIKIAFIIGLLFVLPFYFFIGKKGTPGAGDNLIASTMAIKVGKMFAEERKHHVPLLQHTRLIILSNDAEEAGLRGANIYCKHHRKDLQSIPTFDFNLDSIYKLSELQFMSSDINGTIRLSKNMANECKIIAEDFGFHAKVIPIPFGGGGTDAAEFAKIGVESTTLLSMSTDHNREGLVYHTMEDTVEHIEPEAVEACLKIMARYIMKKEKEISQE
ncbi:hypothetical protein WKT22_03507 [Candidatus Lokiarchaeum ossiferum]